MSYQQKESPASGGPPGMYLKQTQNSPKVRAKEDPPPSQPTIMPMFDDDEKEPSNTDGNATTPTASFVNQMVQNESTEREILLEDQSNQNPTTEELVNRLPISEEDKEKIIEVMIRKKISMKQEDNSNWNESYEDQEDNQNDDNVTQPETNQSDDDFEDDESFGDASHTPSRPTGTGSEQLKLWISEVNKAVGTNTNRWNLNTDDRSLATRPSAQHAFSPTKGCESITAVATNKQQDDAEEAEPPRKTLSPTKAQNFFPSNRKDGMPNKLYAYTPVREKPATPRKNQDVACVKECENHPCQQEQEEQISSENDPVTFERFKQEMNLAGGTYQEDHSSSDRHDYTFMENYIPAPEKKELKTSVQDARKSKKLMQSIEGKYKNLRDNLIEDPTSMEEHCMGDRGSYDSRSTAYSDPINSIVSSVGTSKEDPNTPFSVREHFSLGILSTRTSGIISIPSWDSAISYDSDSSERLFPVRACSAVLPPVRGCGLFMCRYED